MTKEQLYLAIGNVEESYIAAAEQPVPKRAVWLRWGAAAACVCLTVCVVGQAYMKPEETTTDIEPMVSLTAEEAVQQRPLGALYPQVMLTGYELENETVSLYNETVMTGIYINEETGDVLSVTVAGDEYFGDVEYDVVTYSGDIDDEEDSQIYITSEGYTISYRFENRDINEIEDFDLMVASAACFQKENET